MKKSFIRIIMLSFWVIGGITVVPMSLYILFSSVNTEDVIISPIIIHTVAIIWFLSIVWNLFLGSKNAKRDLQEFRDKQSIRQEKQKEYLASKKSPSRLARTIAISGLIVGSIYLSHFLSSSEILSTRMKIFGWLALFGLAIFFVKLLGSHGNEREKLWKIFFHGTGYVSEKERYEANRDIIIMVALTVLGILAFLFL